MPRVGTTSLITCDRWMPAEPVDMIGVKLDWVDDPAPPEFNGTERQTTSVRPLVSPKQRYRRYTHAIRDLVRPTLFENRLSYRLLDVDFEGTGRLTFGPTTYFDMLDVCEAVAHELAAAHLRPAGDDASTSTEFHKASWRRQPFRKLIGDPFNLARRPLLPSIITLTVRRTAEGATFILHRRDSGQVAVEAHMKESTLNRADLLTLSPVLRYSLGSRENRLSFRELIDSGRSLIVNLALPHHDARRLFGCLLTVGMESAALSRADNRTGRAPHHLMIDEFSQFMAQSETALTRMLSETRKYGLFCVMAHQNWSQASERLKGALQNVGIELILKAGRLDAEYSARILGSVDPMEVKHLVEDEGAEERSHPAYLSLAEQWEQQVQAIQRLRIGEAFVRLPDDRVHKVRTRTLPAVSLSQPRLAAVRQQYLERYFTGADLQGHPAPDPLPQRSSRITRRPLSTAA